MYTILIQTMTLIEAQILQLAEFSFKLSGDEQFLLNKELL